MYGGNAVRIFQNGAIFDAMEEDIRAARCTVHLETFVWTKGALERRFADLLIQKAREGVSVRLLIDALGGSGRDETQFRRLIDGGVELCIYSEVAPLEPAPLQPSNASQDPRLRWRCRVHVRARIRRHLAGQRAR